MYLLKEKRRNRNECQHNLELEGNIVVKVFMLLICMLAEGLKLDKHATKSILIGGLSRFPDKRFQTQG